jgi:cyanate permease
VFDVKGDFLRRLGKAGARADHPSGSGASIFRMSAAAARPDPYRWALLGGVWLLYFSFGLTVAAMAPLVAPIREALGMSDSAMGSVLGAWPLVYIVAALPCGAALERFGARRVLTVAAGVIGTSCALRAFAVDPVSLFLAVALFGIGGPLVSVGAPKLVAQHFTGRDRGFAMGIYLTGPALGSVTALALTNAVLMPAVDGNWRAVLLIYAGVSVAAGATWHLVSARMKEHAASAGGTGGLGAQIQVFAGLLRRPVVQVVLVMSVATFFLNHGLNNWLPEILRRSGMSAEAAGYWAAIPVLVGVLGSLTIPRLALPHRRLWMLLALIAAAATATALLHLPAGPGLASGLVLQGIVRSSLMTLLMLVLIEAEGIGSKHAGSASALFFSAAEIGGVLGPVTLGVTADLTGAFDAGLWLLTGLCAAMAVLLIRLRALLRDPGVPG